MDNDLFNDYKQKAEEALEDLRAFVEKHGCLINFLDGNVSLSWVTGDLQDIILDAIGQRWQWNVVAPETGEIIAHDESATLKKWQAHLKRAQALMPLLQPEDQVKLMQRLAIGEESIEQILVDYENITRQTSSNDTLQVPLAESFDEVKRSCKKRKIK